MVSSLSAKDVFNAQGVIIDVRSESEFREASIPGAVSLPLLNDAERAEVGTLYKQRSPEIARARGKEIVTPKLADFFRNFAVLSGMHDLREPLLETLAAAFETVTKELWEDLGSPEALGSPKGLSPSTILVVPLSPSVSNSDLDFRSPSYSDSSFRPDEQLLTPQPDARMQLIFYCWRGGARSKSLARFGEILGFRTAYVQGGHKLFRAHVQSFLESAPYPFKLCTLYGLTGAGKTKIIRQWLKEKRAVLDLEALAHHRGSAFGQVGIDQTGRQKDFENNLFWQMKLLAKRGEKTVVVEGESRRIGRCQLPIAFMEAMKTGFKVKVECPIERRVQNILDDYVHPLGLDEARLHREAQGSLDAIKKRLGGEAHQEMSALLAEKNYSAFTRELLVQYYDKMYSLSQAADDHYDAVISDAADFEVLLQMF